MINVAEEGCGWPLLRSARERNCSRGSSVLERQEVREPDRPLLRVTHGEFGRCCQLQWGMVENGGSMHNAFDPLAYQRRHRPQAPL